MLRPKGWSDRIKKSRQLLYAAVEHHDTQILSAMLAAGASLPDSPEGHETLINRCINFWGATKSTLPYIRLLVKAGVNVNTKGFHGSTPRLVAFMAKDYELAEYLIETGADQTIPNDNGFDVVYCLIRQNNMPLFEKFLPYFLQEFPQSALLDHAIKSNSETHVDKLLAMGWEVSLESAVWAQENPDQVSDKVRAKVDQALFSSKTQHPSTTASRTHRL